MSSGMSGIRDASMVRLPRAIGIRSEVGSGLDTNCDGFVEPGPVYRGFLVLALRL